MNNKTNKFASVKITTARIHKNKEKEQTKSHKRKTIISNQTNKSVIEINQKNNNEPRTGTKRK